MTAKIVDWRGGKQMQENEVEIVMLDPHDFCVRNMFCN